MAETSLSNPTSAVDLSFEKYLQSREKQLSAHMVNGVPDYGFSLDHKLRQQLASMGPVRAIAQAMTSMQVPFQKQMYQMQGIAVSPRQYPKIYAMAEDCARTLGIGVPQVFVLPQSDLNAFTIATNDVEPLIVLSSSLVEAFEPAELKFVIGHECGHIHNLHGVYNTAAVMMADPMAQGILSLMNLAGAPLGVLNMAVGALQLGLKLFLMRWSRCGEVTSDRAGVICCGDVTVATRAMAKLATGGGKLLKDLNLDEYVKQIASVQATPIRIMELQQTHPLIPKRIEAIRLFERCEVLHAWRPEMRSGETTLSKDELDTKCEQFISVLNAKTEAKES